MHSRLIHICLGVLFLLITAIPAEAQYLHRYRTSTAKVKKDIARKNNVYAHRMDSLIQAFRADTFAYADTLSNPYYSMLLTRPQIYDASLSRIFGIDYSPGHSEECTSASSSRDIYDLVSHADSSLLYTWTQYPQMVLPPFNGEEKAKEEGKKKREDKKVTLSDHLDAPIVASDNQLVTPDDDIQIIARKPNFWTFKTNFSLQFTQNYVSDNWYKGGESNNALLASTVIEANFNNQQKLTFDNKLEMKLGFQSSHDDKEHKFKTNSDLIRLTNKVGWQAAKRWYYTMSLQSWTQFYPGYKSNDAKVYSDFMSPFESLLSIGMDYKFTSKNKKFNITASLSPLALKLKYVDRPSLITTFGLDEGHHAKWTYGSNITVNYTWTIVKNVSWTSRFYFFTDYSNTQVEWENTFNLTINRYLSTKLFLYPRFDDSRTRDAGVSDFEFNELLSLGLNVDF